MPSVTIKKEKKNEITIVKKMRDYSSDPTFKKKAEKAVAFLKNNGQPKRLSKKKK